MTKKIKSGNLLPDRMDDISLPLENARRLKLNRLNVPLRVDVPDPRSAEMSLHPQAFHQAAKAMEEIRQAGLAAFLEPFPWVRAGGLAETAWDPGDVNAWFEQWGKICLQAAYFAHQEGIDTLVISDGIIRLEPYPEQWIALIEDIRKLYRGRITYRTQWWYTSWANPVSFLDYRRKLQNPLFGKLDFISISAYFELTNREGPSEKELIDAWRRSTRYMRRQPIVEQVKELHQQWRKPIFFGEVGYVDRAGTNRMPWSAIPSEKENLQEQRDCFAAFFRVFWHQPWFLGASIFQIHMPESPYYPMGRPAEAVIAAAPTEVFGNAWTAGLRDLLNRFEKGDFRQKGK
ncbi:glycoside hydrolase family 113 [Heliomicrobium modesticaldum]|uniref:glycoside hydrolase family 113 n=1 Tax=Heliomicrobium modesticaldum TaxID=35701 RepID=UPI003AABA985